MALNDEQKEQIKALLATGAAKNDVARKCNVSWATVDKISKEAPDKLENFREFKRQAMIDKIWTMLEDAAELGHTMITEAKQGKRDIPLNHVSTFYGTMYDKQALMQGENTANIGGDGLKVVLNMPDVKSEDEWNQ
jgi:hypothetical protein